MESESIVPNIIPKVPSQILKITYNDGVRAELGNQLRPNQSKSQPEVRWKLYDGDVDAYYTLAMIDPDAPTRMAPFLGEVNHWLVGNIKGNDLNSGRTLSEYRGCGPPRGTGLHRYIFLLYKQNGSLEFDEQTIPSSNRMSRIRFSIKKFAKKYKLGEPIAGNFFKSQWDSCDDRND